MRLPSGGIDIFYIDESNDRDLFAVTAVAVPMLRAVDGMWQITWPAHLDGAKAWRNLISRRAKIPTTKELHGTDLIGARGHYLYGSRPIPKAKAKDYYGWMLSKVDFIPAASVLTVVGERGRVMYGHQKLERAMNVLFQRMRMQCRERGVAAMIFFDEGHPEYRALYRKARAFMQVGAAGGGTTYQRSLSMFIEDGNFKNSRHCHFTQLADLIAFAALAKVRHEKGVMIEAQIINRVHQIYDELPRHLVNTKASRKDADGIVRLG